MSSNSPSVCSNPAYLNSINQKSRFQLFNIPANRYDNLAQNPYLKINPATGQPYTKTELDMRRKAEILKYNSNRMSSQTNSLTKAQIFAQVANGSYQKRTYSQEFINQNTQNGVLNICPPGVIVKTPSSASDVPGNMLLYDDPAIPLYNLVNDNTTASYGLINPVLDPYGNGFQYTNEYNIRSTPTIFTVYMFNNTQPNYRFSFSTPLMLQFSGGLNSSILPTNITSPFTFQILLNTVSLNINYSYSPMTLNNGITYNINGYPISGQTLFDISVNPQYAAFNGSCYLGSINVSNIVLPVSLGYIYDFQLSISYSINYPSNSTYQTYYYPPSINTVFNVTKGITPSQTNCIITSRNPPIPPNIQIRPLIVSGVPSS